MNGAKGCRGILDKEENLMKHDHWVRSVGVLVAMGFIVMGSGVRGMCEELASSSTDTGGTDPLSSRGTSRYCKPVPLVTIRICPDGATTLDDSCDKCPASTDGVPPAN